MKRKQIITVIDKIIKSETETEAVTPTLVSEYEELNEKCDCVIAKIRNRKEKSSKTNEVK